MANALAYYDTATITAVKCFIVQALGWKDPPGTNTPTYWPHLKVTKKIKCCEYALIIILREIDRFCCKLVPFGFDNTKSQ